MSELSLSVERFRKKPVTIEAVQYDGTPGSYRAIALWAPVFWSCARAPDIMIETLEGTLYANPGDWIIRGIKGEFYPCKPDIFAATYEIAQDE